MTQAIATGRVGLGPTRLGARITRLRQETGVWLFLVPALIFFVGYQVWPIIRVVWISFTDYQYLSTNPPSWVGLHNYVEGFTDPLMWKSLWRAALFTIMFLPGTIILPLLLAILIDRVRNPRLATIYRVILLIPAVIPSTLVFVLWKWMYNYQSGPINHFLVDTLGVFTLYNAPQWLFVSRRCCRRLRVSCDRPHHHPFGRKMRSRKIITTIIETAPIMPIAAAKPWRQSPSLNAWSYMKMVQV